MSTAPLSRHPARSTLTRPVVLGALLLGACNGPDDPGPVDTDTDVVGPPRTVSLRTRAAFGNDAATCERSFEQVGTTNQRVRLVDFRLFVHDVALLDAAGTVFPVTLTADSMWSDGTVTLLDFATDVGDCEGGAGLNSDIVGTVADIVPAGIRFTLGLPRTAATAANDETALPPLDVEDLFINSTIGRMHSRVSLLSEGTSSVYTSRVHALCTSAQSCTEENTMVVTLDGFDDVDTSEIVFDLSALVSRNDVSGDGCTGLPTDPDCQTYFVSYGLGAMPPEWIGVD